MTKEDITDLWTKSTPPDGLKKFTIHDKEAHVQVFSTYSWEEVKKMYRDLWGFKKQLMGDPRKMDRED